MNKYLLIAVSIVGTVLISGLITINFNHFLHLPELKPIQIVQHRFIDGHFPFVHLKTDIRLKSELGDLSTLDKVDQVLVEASTGDVVEFHLAGYGGDGESMFLLIDNIHSTKATTVMHVEAPVYSAYSYIAVSGTYLAMDPHSLLMFHTISSYGFDCSSVPGLDRTLPASIKCQQQLDALVNESNVLIQSIVVLTQQEKDALKTGHDIYITSQEVYRRAHGETPIVTPEPVLPVSIPQTMTLILQG